MVPTIGRVVIYNTTEEDRKKIEAAKELLGGCNIQEKLPAIVVAVWGDTEEAAVNLKVFVDGHLEIWITSSVKGDNEGEWNWPEIKK